MLNSYYFGNRSNSAAGKQENWQRAQQVSGRLARALHCCVVTMRQCRECALLVHNSCNAAIIVWRPMHCSMERVTWLIGG